MYIATIYSHKENLAFFTAMAKCEVVGKVNYAGSDVYTRFSGLCG
jgi:hypothetical protein